MTILSFVVLSALAVAGSARQLGEASRTLLAPMQDCCCSMDGKTCLPASSSKMNGMCQSTVPMAKMCSDSDLGYTGMGKTPMMNSAAMPMGSNAAAMPMPAGSNGMMSSNAAAMPMPAGSNGMMASNGMMGMAGAPNSMGMMSNSARAPMMMMNNGMSSSMPAGGSMMPGSAAGR